MEKSLSIEELQCHFLQRHFLFHICPEGYYIYHVPLACLFLKNKFYELLS